MSETVIQLQKEQLKGELSQLLTQLPSNWKSIIVANHPEYGYMKNYNRLVSVQRGKSTNKEVIELMKKVVSGEITIATA